MQHILVIGTNQLAKDIITFSFDHPNLKLFAISSEKEEDFHTFARHYDVQIFSQIESCQQVAFDYICVTEDHVEREKQVSQSLPDVPIIPLTVMELLHAVIRKKMAFSFKQINEFKNLHTMLNTIRDGIIVIDEEENIQFINEAACQMIACHPEDVLHEKIKQVLPHSRLPLILQTQDKEIDTQFQLSENKSIVTTRIPLFNENNLLVGAFAIFKDHEDVIKLAEENTNIKELQMMLEAIIHASGDAISVVDENGKGLMFNTAYTKLTGLKAEDVIGKPATVDILEGDSIHLQVIKKRRAIHGVPMKIGKHQKEVIVNASPIIVSGKMRGSIAVIHDVSDIKHLSGELKKAKQMIRHLESSFTFTDIIGHSAHIRLAIEQAKIAATSSMFVLLKGEHGVGKELFAHAIHNEGDRKYNKFIRVNCTHIPESMIDSELFGYEETQLTNKRSIYEKGVLEEANDGTIFLDEIGHLPLATQKKLLDTMTKQEMIRIGGETAVPLNIQIIAASSSSLQEKVMDGTFYQPLYDKINTFPITIPSLRNRLDDLYELVQLIISEKNEWYGRNVKNISTDALYELKSYSWPGNVRELENVIDRAMIFMKQSETTIHKEHLPLLQMPEKPKQEKVIRNDYHSLQEAVDDFERKYIGDIYRKNKFNKSKTAKELRISLRNLYYKIEKYQLDYLINEE